MSLWKASLSCSHGQSPFRKVHAFFLSPFCLDCGHYSLELQYPSCDHEAKSVRVKTTHTGSQKDQKSEKILGAWWYCRSIKNISKRFNEQAAKWHPSTFTLKQLGDLGIGNKGEDNRSQKLGFLVVGLSYLVWH